MKYAVLGSVLLLVGLSVLFVMRGGAISQPTPTSSEIRFGFITNVDGDTITFDEARWLTGKEGEDAAIAAGLCTEATRAECLPNDFYILNEETTTEELSFTNDAVIAMATLHMEEEGVQESQISIADFEKLINDQTLHWTKVPYQMIVENGKITILEEVYIP